MQSEKPEGLVRVIGVRGVAINVINLTIGAGIFGLPALVAAQLGPAGVLAYLLCGILICLVMLCYAEIGSKLTDAGGVYTYVGSAFGQYPGFITNMLYVIYALGAHAAIANLLIDNVTILFPWLSNTYLRSIFLAFVIGGIAWLNVLGIKQGMRLVVVVTLSKIIPLLALILVGVWFISPENLTWSETPSLKSFGEGAIILFFAFGGGESALNSSGEIKDPSRSIPRGILFGVLSVFIIYFSIQLVSQGILGIELAKQAGAPLAAVADKIVPGYGTLLMIIGAAVSCFGVLSGDVPTNSRLPYAAARDGLLPAFLAKVHPKYSTPYWSVILYACAGYALALSGGFRQLAILSSGALLLVYILVILSTIKIRKTKTENSFSIPGGLVIPIMALGATGWFLSNLSKTEIVTVVAFLAFFSVVYLFFKRILNKERKLDSKE